MRIAPAARMPAAAAGTRPVASSSTITAMMPSEISASRPMGATWRRTSSGLSTTSASGGAM